MRFHQCMRRKFEAIGFLKAFILCQSGKSLLHNIRHWLIGDTTEDLDLRIACKVLREHNKQKRIVFEGTSREVMKKL